MRWILLLLVLGVVAEVAVLVLAVQNIGWLWTLLLLVGTAVLGGYLWRREGARAWRSLAEVPPEPDAVGSRITDAALVLVGGILLIVPGFISDVLALVCLLPPTRAIARRGVGALLRPWRDRADLIDLRIRPDTVVQGEAVPDATDPHRPSRRPGDDDDHLIIRGEIEP